MHQQLSGPTSTGDSVGGSTRASCIHLSVPPESTALWLPDSVIPFVLGALAAYNTYRHIPPKYQQEQHTQCGPLVLGRDPRRALNVLTPPLSHLCYIYSHRHPQIIDFAVYAMSRKEAEKAQQQPHLLRFIYISSGNLRKRLKAVFLI